MKFFKNFCFLITVGTVVTSTAHSMIGRIAQDLFKTTSRSVIPLSQQHRFSTQKEKPPFLLEEKKQVGITVFSHNLLAYDELSRIINTLYPRCQVTLTTFDGNQNESRFTVEGLIKNTKIFFTVPQGHDYEEPVRISDMYCQKIKYLTCLESLVTTQGKSPIVLFGTQKSLQRHPFHFTSIPFSNKYTKPNKLEVSRLFYHPLSTEKFSLENLELL
jgi:hypothetical protein